MQFPGTKDLSLLAAALAMVGLLSSCSKHRETGDENGESAAKHMVGETPDDGQDIAGQNKQHTVSAILQSEPNCVHAGEAFQLDLRIQIAPGWHIGAADKPTGVAAATKIDLRLPVGLEQTSRWEADEKPIPDSSVSDLAFVHTDRVTFHCKARAVGNFQSERATICSTLHYQACNQFICRIPETLELETEIQLIK
jgi:DsbC/DsbD-like thiol-disulfide interchange protein